MAARRILSRTFDNLVTSGALLVLLFTACLPVLGEVTFAADEDISGGSPVSGQVNQQIPISDITVTGIGNDVISMTIAAPSATVYMTSVAGLTFAGPSLGPSISFSGTRSAINTALATLRYASTHVGEFEVTVSFGDSNTIYNPDNGHIYQYVDGSYEFYDEESDDTYTLYKTWQEAYDEAIAMEWDGIPGYLATVTSEEEDTFISERLEGSAWLGGRDEWAEVDPDHETYEEGKWQWVNGPEEGTVFSIWDEAEDGQYANWAGGEPNELDGEECLQTYIEEGHWNDFLCDDTSGYVQGYVVEYGSLEDLPTPLASVTVDVTVGAVTYPEGDGSEENPYVITDCMRLQGMNQDMSSSTFYVLGNDIDCNETVNWNGGQGFVPIGNDEDSFNSMFDGAGHTIDGLTIIRADDDPDTDSGTDPVWNQSYVGLFGMTNGMDITNVHLTDAHIKGYEYVGGLVGYAYETYISGSSVNANITNTTDHTCNNVCVWARYGAYGGGLVGQAASSFITDSQTGGPVKGSGIYIGGLVGYTSDTTIQESSSTSPADGGSYVGGAVGFAGNNTDIARVYTSGDIEVTDELYKSGVYGGGLVGYAYGTDISQSRATGDVNAVYYDAGGLVGQMDYTMISDSYATGDVSTGTNAGGLVGREYGSNIYRSYASGHVSAGEYQAGGLIGEASDSGWVESSFAVGAVNAGEDYEGGIFGYLDGSGSFEEVYFGTNSTGQENCASNTEVEGCMGIASNGYFTDKANPPFTYEDSEIWLDSVWAFECGDLPVFVGETDGDCDDNDGVSAEVEDNGPNGGDANDDGRADSEQANVAALFDAISNNYVVIAIGDESCELSGVSVVASGTLGSDGGYKYPFGLVNFTASCGVADITLYFYGAAGDDFVLRKHVGGSFRAVPEAGMERVIIASQQVLKVSYTVTDGGPLDDDGAVNGSITDPAGPAVLAAGSLANTGQGIIPHLIFSLCLILIAGVMAVVDVRTSKKQPRP